MRDQVERDVEAAVLRHDSVGMSVDRLVVERIDDRRLRGATVSANPGGDVIEGRERTPGKVNASALLREGRRNGTANRPPAAIDDSVLPFEQHRVSFHGYR